MAAFAGYKIATNLREKYRINRLKRNKVFRPRETLKMQFTPIRHLVNSEFPDHI